MHAKTRGKFPNLGAKPAVAAQDNTPLIPAIPTLYYVMPTNKAGNNLGKSAGRVNVGLREKNAHPNLHY